MAMTFDPQAVRAFEHAGWQRAAAHYAATFAQATRGFIDDLLEAARIGAGMRVLDLACGPGFVSAAVAERGRSRWGSISHRQWSDWRGPTTPASGSKRATRRALPFADGSFDAVVANFGVHHVP